MNLDINLSNKQEEKRGVSKALFFAILFTVLSVVVFITLFTYMQLLRSNARTYAAETVSIESQITRALSQQDNYVVFVNKISAISRLFSGRVPQDARLAMLFAQIPQAIEITQIDAENDSTRLQLSSGDLNAMNSFLDTGLTQVSSSPGVARVDVVSFERTADNAIYTASILVTYTDEK